MLIRPSGDRRIWLHWLVGDLLVTQRRSLCGQSVRCSPIENDLSQTCFLRTVRPAKINVVKATFPDAKDLEVIGVDDIATGNYGAVMDGESVLALMLSITVS